MMEIKDPRLVPVSITHVKVSRDLSRATVSVMPLGGGAMPQEVVDALRDAGKQMRGPIGRALRLRHAPEIVFQTDIHTEQAIKITSLLDQLTADREGREGSEDDV
jgi:ribosome-binding factor A